MTEDLKQKAEAKFNDFSELFTRMQTDADLVNLATYTLKDVHNHKLANAVSITLNDPATFAWRIETVLNSAIEQIDVQAEGKRFDTAYVERFLKAAFKAADELLPMKDLYPLNPFIDQQTCRRGRVASRCLFQVEDGQLKPDILPWDTRYFVYWMDKKGLAGVTYKTKRSKDIISSEYPDARFDGKDGSVEVWDIWTTEVNEVWVGGERILSQKNPFGYVPVVFHKVPMGSMLLDEDTLKYQGESIFFLIRDLLPELNRLVSILQSINLKQIDQALQFRVPREDITTNMNVKGHDEVTAPGVVNVVPAGGGYDFMPIGEMKQQAVMLHEMIQTRIDEATGKKFQNIAQPKTATEIIALGQEQNNLIFPRLATRGLLKEGLAKMLLKQVIGSGETTVKLGNQEWEVGKLKGEYEVEFKYHFKDPKMDIARTSMAAAQRGLLSDKMIRRDTLQLADPEGAERELALEEVLRMNPVLNIRDKIMKLIEDIDNGGDNMLWEIECDSQYCPMLEQSIMGIHPQSSPEVKPSQPLVPMTGGGV